MLAKMNYKINTLTEADFLLTFCHYLFEEDEAKDLFCKSMSWVYFMAVNYTVSRGIESAAVAIAALCFELQAMGDSYRPQRDQLVTFVENMGRSDLLRHACLLSQLFMWQAQELYLSDDAPLASDQFLLMLKEGHIWAFPWETTEYGTYEEPKDEENNHCRMSIISQQAGRGCMQVQTNSFLHSPDVRNPTEEPESGGTDES
jgi:hypothetical protein